MTERGRRVRFRRLLRNEWELEVGGFHLTVRRIIGIAVLFCLLGLFAYSLTQLGSDGADAPDVNNTTGRYEEGEFKWPLCVVFVFLAIVVIAVLVLEIGSG